GRGEAGREARVGGAEFIDGAAGPEAERVVQQAEIGVVVHVVAFPRTVPSGRRLPLYGERNRRRKPAIPGGRTVARGAREEQAMTEQAERLPGRRQRLAHACKRAGLLSTPTGRRGLALRDPRTRAHH